MKSRIVLVSIKMLIALSFLTSVPHVVSAQNPLFLAQQQEAMFEFVGQVKNFPAAGPGLPQTSV
ncbi:MAG: hypothetical protein WB723_19305, partial [Candidatus Acidiferrales bacterium]